MTITWYRRFADIPGVDYTPEVDFDPRHLRGHDAKPEVSVYEFEGKRRESLMWPFGSDGSTSSSPTQQHADARDEGGTAESVMKNLRESLELPGEARDYHFVISGAAAALWPYRRRDPQALAWIEELHWLDIRFVEAAPEVVHDEYSEDRPFVTIPAYEGLIQLYEREGRLADALAIARRAQQFNQGEPSIERLEEKLRLVSAEDGV